MLEERLTQIDFRALKKKETKKKPNLEVESGKRKGPKTGNRKKSAK